MAVEWPGASYRVQSILHTTTAAARTLLYIKAPATACWQVTRAWLSNASDVASEQLAVRLMQPTADGAAAGTTVTPEPFSDLFAAAGGTVLTHLTAEPTYAGADPWGFHFNEGVGTLNGLRWEAGQGGGIVLAPSTRFAIFMAEAPAVNFNYYVGCELHIVGA